MLVRSDVIKTVFLRLVTMVIDQVVDQGRVLCVRARSSAWAVSYPANGHYSK
jgi:hypothetical protein